MADIDVEMGAPNPGVENSRNNSAFEDQRYTAETKPTIQARLLTNLERLFRQQKTPTVETHPDDLEQLLEGADDVSTAGVRASLRKDYMLFKSVPGTELTKSLVLFKCFAPPVAGIYG